MSLNLQSKICNLKFLLLVVVAGCSGSADLGDVRGTVTVDGEPLAKGAIRFVPVDGKAPTSGGVIKDGQYAVQVPIGLMRVSISAARVVGKVKLYDTPGSRERDVTEEMLPARYNEETELRLEVTPGNVERNFELTSK